MSEPEATTPDRVPPTAQPPGEAWRWAALLLAVIGLCISCYLAWLSLTGQTAPGCGGDAGCGEVLGSRWSAIGPVPVSVLAGGGYAAILALLAFQPWRRWNPSVWLGLLGGMGVALIGAAVWFIFLQAKVIGAWCPYCMGGHLIGVVLGLLLFMPTTRRRAQWCWALLIAIALLSTLVNAQLGLPASGKSVALPTDRDFDLTDDTGRHLGLIDGKLKLDAADTPHRGPSDGGDVVVLLLDYGCPHCREAHEMLNEELGSRAGLVVFALPASLHEDHNPHIPVDHERFENSYELAQLSLAVWRDAPEQWSAFDQWLFEGNEAMEGEYAWPRNLDAAERYAEELIGADAVAQAYRDDALVAQVERNIGVIGQVLSASPEAVPGLPIAMSPRASGAIYGRFDEPRLLDVLLEDARDGR